MKSRRFNVGRVLSPSTAWRAAIIAVVVGAVASGIAAVALTAAPVGRTDGVALVADDTDLATTRIADVDAPGVDEELRHIRNALDVEAVSLVAPDGRIMRSTAGSLQQTTVGSEAVTAMTSGAVSVAEITVATRIDVAGVVEWMPGSSIVQVVAPIGDGNGVAIIYDPAEIASRRIAAGERSPLVVPLMMFTAIFALAAILLEVARRQVASAATQAAEAQSTMRTAAQEVKTAEDELEAERSRSQLRSRSTVSSIHEQRTLLTGVLTGAELLSDSIHLDMTERDLLENVIADAERLETLTDQMLVASGADAGLQVRLRLQPLSLVIDKLRRADTRANISMTQSLGMGPIDITTDVSVLAQLVAELVDNSCSHGADRVEIVVTDSIPGTIHHRLGPSPQSAIYIAVVDDGPGIDHDFLPKAFEPFESGRRTRGKGMGLYLVSMMVEAIGATLSVITSPKGTVMAVAVPARAGEQAA
jgi:signal transduction histidine kinase